MRMSSDAPDERDLVDSRELMYLLDVEEEELLSMARDGELGDAYLVGGRVMFRHEGSRAEDESIIAAEPIEEAAPVQEETDQTPSDDLPHGSLLWVIVLGAVSASVIVAGAVVFVGILSNMLTEFHGG